MDKNDLATVRRPVVDLKTQPKGKCHRDQLLWSILLKIGFFISMTVKMTPEYIYDSAKIQRTNATCRRANADAN